MEKKKKHPVYFPTTVLADNCKTFELAGTVRTSRNRNDTCAVFAKSVDLPIRNRSNGSFSVQPSNHPLRKPGLQFWFVAGACQGLCLRRGAIGNDAQFFFGVTIPLIPAQLGGVCLFIPPCKWRIKEKEHIYGSNCYSLQQLCTSWILLAPGIRNGPAFPGQTAVHTNANHWA